VQPAVVAEPPSPAPVVVQRPRSRAPLATFLVAFTGVLVTTWSGSPLAYDGAPILLRTMHHRSPFVTHDRYVTALFKLPAALAVVVLDRASAARVAFDAVYAALPLVAVVITWLLLRRDAPRLAVWAALGTFVVLAPGQVFAVSEAQTIVALAWPLLLVTAIGMPRPVHRWSAIALAALLVTMHPFAVLLLALVGAVAVLGVLLGRLPRPLTWWGAALLALAVFRWALLDPYERSQTTAETLRMSWGRGVSGAPLLVVVLALVAGVALVVASRVAVARRTLLVAPIAPVVAAVVVLAWWSSDATRWERASAYRTYALILSVPFFALAIVDAWVGRRVRDDDPDLLRALGTLGVCSALAFTVTAVGQGMTWHRLTDEYSRNLAAAPTTCVTRQQVVPDPPGPLLHWSRNSLAIVLQGRDPQHIVLSNAGACRRWHDGSVPAVVGHGRTLGDGWVRLPRP
jgi:hypothetical protein